MMVFKKETIIVGAGLAGMVAAINLARAGRRAVVLEAESRIGGSEALHPSLHITPINRAEIWKYIGIDLNDCFIPTETFISYLGDKRYDLYPNYFFIVERGPRKTSVDNRLYEIAMDAGVTFHFSERVNNLDDLLPDTIIATGLDRGMFNNLGLPYRDIPSRHIFQPTDRKHYALGIFSEVASEYFYAAAHNELFYGMLPLEDPPNPNNLSRLVEDLGRWEGIEIPENQWRPVVFRVPLGSVENLCLFRGDKILAGTVGGMMDPFYLFGIHGALVSGKIAALTVMDREKGQKEFNRVNRYFLRTFRAKQLYEKMPVKTRLALFNAFAKKPFLFSPFIQMISRGIPGHEDTDFFYRSFVGPDYEPPLAFRLGGILLSAISRAASGSLRRQL